MNAKIIQMPIQPTTQERYQHLRGNAEAFVTSIAAMVEALERDGKSKQASELKVWALMPWQAALRDDDTGDLWWICEACEKPIKDGTEVAAEDCCWLHRACIATDQQKAGEKP